jgi:two-component system, OmpR family, response regulator
MTDKVLKNIICVEDEEDIRKILKFSLERIGKFNVNYCTSGFELLSNVEALMPDLILLDIMMPNMDGIETLAKLKKLESVKNIPVIFMTAKVQANEIDEYYKMGVLSVIPKPFDPISLPTKILEVWQSQT